MTKSSPAVFHYCGFAILLALTIGGISQWGLWSDHLLELIFLPMIIIGLVRINSGRLSIAGKLWVFAILGALFLQFMPMTRNLEIGAIPFTVTTSFFSVAPERSLHSAAFAVCLLGLTLVVSSFSDIDQKRLIRYFLIGLLANLMLGTMQLAWSSDEPFTGLLPYPIRRGIFANENHFSVACAMLVPILTYYFHNGQKRPALLFSIVGVMLVYIFAIGSQSGMILLPLATVFSLLFYFGKKLPPKIFVGLVLGSFALPLLVLGLLGFGVGDIGGLRQNILSTTFDALSDHWVLGTGLGSFDVVYSLYENREVIYSRFINHAHNDFAELILETGLVGVVILLGGVTIMARNVLTKHLTLCVAFSAVLVLVHSMVDYPLRTFGVGVIFAYSLGVLLSYKQNESTEISQ